MIAGFWQCLLRNSFAPPPGQIQNTLKKVAAFDRNHWQHIIGIGGRVCAGLSIVSLIHDLGKNNKYYKDFYGAIEISGSLSPSIVAGFLSFFFYVAMDKKLDAFWHSF